MDKKMFKRGKRGTTDLLLAVIAIELGYIAIKATQILSELESISDGSKRPPVPPVPPVQKPVEVAVGG